MRYFLEEHELQRFARETGNTVAFCRRMDRLIGWTLIVFFVSVIVVGAFAVPVLIHHARVHWSPLTPAHEPPHPDPLPRGGEGARLP